MDGRPLDLVPLPTMPYNERPLELPLDIEECRTALWMSDGNITDAAKRLKISSGRLRTFIKNSRYLSAEMEEAREQIKDMAEGIVREALLDSEDKGRQDAMARFVLTGPGKDRGYGTGAPKVTINNGQGGTINIAWADGTEIGPRHPDVEDAEYSVVSDAAE